METVLYLYVHIDSDTTVSKTTLFHSGGTAVNRIITIIKSTINTDITAVVY